MKKFICTVCGYIHEGDAAPEKCPLCKAPASKFNEMVETEGGLYHFLGCSKEIGFVNQRIPLAGRTFYQGFKIKIQA